MLVTSIALGWTIALGLVLIFSGFIKLIDRRGGAGSALSALLPRKHSTAVWFATSAVEVAVGLAAVVTSSPIAALTMGILMVCACTFGLIQQKYASDKPCGCFGRFSLEVRSRGQIRARVVVNGLFALLSFVSAFILSRNTGGAHLLGYGWIIAIPALAGIVIAVAEMRQLASESRRRTYRHTTTMARRLLIGKTCERVRWNKRDMVEDLRNNTTWQRYTPFAVEDTANGDYWHEACWEMVSVAAEYRGSPATAIFGRHHGGDEMTYRFAMISDLDQLIMRFDVPKR